MKNDEIKKAFDSVEPDESAKKRMFESAVERANRAPKKNHFAVNIAVLSAASLALIAGTVIMLAKLAPKPDYNAPYAPETDGNELQQAYEDVPAQTDGVVETSGNEQQRVFFTGTVIYANDDCFFVSMDGDGTPSSSLYTVGVQGIKPERSHIGEKVKIGYSGYILDSYPGQICDAFSIEFTPVPPGTPTLGDVSQIIIENYDENEPENSAKKYLLADGSPVRLDCNGYFFENYDGVMQIEIGREPQDGANIIIAVSPNGWLRIDEYMYYIGEDNAAAFIKAEKPYHEKYVDYETVPKCPAR